MDRKRKYVDAVNKVTEEVNSKQDDAFAIGIGLAHLAGIRLVLESEYEEIELGSDVERELDEAKRYIAEKSTYLTTKFDERHSNKKVRNVQ